MRRAIEAAGQRALDEQQQVQLLEDRSVGGYLKHVFNRLFEFVLKCVVCRLFCLQPAAAVLCFGASPDEPR